jgi:hypothetical protein
MSASFSSFDKGVHYKVDYSQCVDNAYFHILDGEIEPLIITFRVGVILH